MRCAIVQRTDDARPPNVGIISLKKHVNRPWLGSSTARVPTNSLAKPGQTGAVARRTRLVATPEEEEEQEQGLFRANTVNEEDPGRDRATWRRK